METNVISKIKDFIITKLSVDERVALEGLNPTAEKPTMPVDEKKPSTEQTPEVKLKEGMKKYFQGSGIEKAIDKYSQI